MKYLYLLPLVLMISCTSLLENRSVDDLILDEVNKIAEKEIEQHTVS